MSGSSSPAQFAGFVRPSLGRALRADGIAFAANRGEPFTFSSRRAEWRNVARLFVQSGDYAGFALYRLRVSLRTARVPLVPWLLNRFCVLGFKLRIGDDVVIAEGVYVPHGAIVIDGHTRIGSGCVITPWVTIAPVRGSSIGPCIGAGVFVGSHASVHGDIGIGQGAQIGAGAVVNTDVAPHTMVAGVPARTIAENLPGRLQLTRRDGEPRE